MNEKEYNKLQDELSGMLKYAKIYSLRAREREMRSYFSGQVDLINILSEMIGNDFSK